jgi:4-methylaminobutanoate oxidase (formaldehyde-forming)
VTRRLVQLQLKGADAPLLYHHEPIYRDGALVGSVTSGAYGHRVDASLGLGYVSCAEGVTNAWLAAGSFEIEVAWKRYPAQVQLGPWYDPKSERVRG